MRSVPARKRKNWRKRLLRTRMRSCHASHHRTASAKPILDHVPLQLQSEFCRWFLLIIEMLQVVTRMLITSSVF